jgi:2-dehydropantoate 2-reductase
VRLLILGAGGTGGYFGGRLAQAGVDVTFLVRERRAARLRERGLQIRSPLGDADVPVAVMLAEELAPARDAAAFDLVILSCKAYDLHSAAEAIAPAVDAGASVLPILNGLRHYPGLDARFGAGKVLGGLCFISATLGEAGEILHLAPPASITFGERDGDPTSARTLALADAFARAGVEHLHSPRIAQAAWVKYSFLAALAAGTCLMRSAVGPIVASEGGEDFMRALYAECLAVSAEAGEPIPGHEQAKALSVLLAHGSPIKASMLRDLEAGRPVEALQIVGDMLHRAQAAGLQAPLLSAAWCHLQAYEAGLPPQAAV